MITPTSRTLDYCRRKGWLIDVTERWIPHAQVRRDTFGFGDLLGICPGQYGATLLQVTSASNIAARLAKIENECSDAAKQWLRAGNQIEVWGWGKRSKRVNGKLWRVRRVRLHCSREGVWTREDLGDG